MRKSKTGHVGITHDEKNKTSPFRVRVYRGDKVFHVGRYKDLETAVKEKEIYIKKLENSPEKSLTEKSIPW